MFGLFKKGSKKKAISTDNIYDEGERKGFEDPETYGHYVAYYYIKVFNSIYYITQCSDYIRKCSTRNNSKCSKWVKDMEDGMVSIDERLIKANELWAVGDLIQLFSIMHIHNWTYQTEKHGSDAYPLYQKYIDEHSVEEVWNECFPSVPLDDNDRGPIVKLLEENAKTFLSSLDDLDIRMMFNYDFVTFIQEYLDILNDLYSKYNLPESTEIKKENTNKKTREVFDGLFSIPIYDDDGNQVN